ncbi:autophagy-related protein 16-1, partial [Elysia marginata]
SCDLRGTLVGSNAGIMSLDYNQDDTFIVGASNDFASRVWSVSDHRLRWKVWVENFLKDLMLSFAFRRLSRDSLGVLSSLMQSHVDILYVLQQVELSKCHSNDDK